MGVRDIRAGGAYIELFVRDMLQKGLNRAAARMKAFGAAVQGIGAGALSLGGLFAAPFFAGIDAASDMQETMNKFDVVFGDRSAAVKEWGDNFAAEIGRSEKQVADFMAGTQDLLVPVGFEPGAAEQMSKQVTGLAVDLASFNNSADADALNDLHAALTGSGEVMKKYGVVLDEAATKQELLNQGIDPKTATNAQKATARWAIILRGTTAAQGDAVRSSGSYANQMKALGAATYNASVALGTAILPVVTTFITKGVSAVGVVGEWIKQNQGLVRIVALVAAVLIGGGAAFLILGTMIGVAGFALSGLSTALGIAAAMLSGFLGILATVASPVGLVVGLIIGAAGALLYFSGVGGEVVGFLTDRFGALWQWVNTVFGGIMAAMNAGDMTAAANILWGSLQVAWQTGTGLLLRIWEGFRNTSLRVFDELRFGVVKIFSGLVGIVASLLAKAGELSGSKMLSNLSNSLMGFGREVAGGAQGAIDQRAAARQAATEQRFAAMQAGIDQAQSELDKSIADANAKMKEIDKAKAKASAAPNYEPPSTTGGIAAAERSVQGTFSGAAAARFSAVSSPIEERTAEATEKTAANTDKMVRQLGKLAVPQFT